MNSLNKIITNDSTQSASWTGLNLLADVAASAPQLVFSSTITGAKRARPEEFSAEKRITKNVTFQVYVDAKIMLDEGFKTSPFLGLRYPTNFEDRAFSNQELKSSQKLCINRRHGSGYIWPTNNDGSLDFIFWMRGSVLSQKLLSLKVSIDDLYERFFSIPKEMLKPGCVEFSFNQIENALCNSFFGHLHNPKFDLLLYQLRAPEPPSVDPETLNSLRFYSSLIRKVPLFFSSVVVDELRALVPEEDVGLNTFISRVLIRLDKESSKKEMIDRDTFQTLISHRGKVFNEAGAPNLSSISEDVKQAPEFSKLLESLSSKSWKEGELKEITLKKLVKEELDYIKKVIEEFFLTPQIKCFFYLAYDLI
jgi:hypothetical protein